MGKYVVKLYSGNHYLFESYECDSVQAVFKMLDNFTYDGCELASNTEGIFSFICIDKENGCFSKIVVEKA